MEKTPAEEMILKLIAWIETSAEFAKEQWPDYVAQYLRAECIKGWVNLSCLLMLIFICFGVLVVCWSFTWHYKGPSYEIPTFIAAGTFFPFFAIIPLLIASVCEINSLITLYVAPKVYVLSHLKGFFK